MGFAGAGFKDDAVDGAFKGKEFRRIIKYFSNKALLIAALIISGICGISSCLLLLVNKKAVNLFQDQDFLSATSDTLKTGAVVAAIIITLQVAANTCQAIVSPLFLVDIRKKLYTSLMYADIVFFDKHSYGGMVSRISEGVAYIRDVYVSLLFIAVNGICASLAGFVVGLIYGWKQTLMFIAFPIGLAIELWLGLKWANHVYAKYQKSGTAATERAVSIVTAFRTVKSFDQELEEAETYQNDLKEEEKILVHVSLVKAFIRMLGMCILSAMVLTVTWYMIREMVKDPESMDMYEMSAIIMGICLLAIGIFSTLSITDDFQQAQEATRNICAIIEMQPTIRPDQGQIIDEIKGEIEFRDVGFRYAGSEQWAVRHLSFKLEAGKTYAFVGESGCGKSTTLQLIQRFYDVEEGAVLIDGIDVRDISPKSLRKGISIVPQSPVLFTMSILDNIRYGNQKATEEDAAQAAITGNAHNFIMELPDNYKTMVAQTSLSGGQKQRICISRAILSPTPILLLDEATAALDTESEQLVQQSLENFRHGKTSIMVAHRLATVTHADEILVFQDGKVAERGNHQSLIDQNGLYADLVKFQLQ